MDTARVSANMVLIFFVFIIFQIAHIHVSALGACPKCGSMEVPYPFSTDESCGDPRYRIYCNNNNNNGAVAHLEFMSAEGFKYKILSIDPNAYKLIISPPDLTVEGENDNHTSCYSADFSSQGLRLDENLPFNISTRNTVILLNCSDNLLRSPLNCSLNSFCRQFEDKMLKGRHISACRGSLCCHYLKDSHMTSHMIRVRVGGCTAYTSVVDIKPEDPVEKWNYGIELQYMLLPPN